MVNDVSRQVIGCAVEVQRALGVGLLESTYAGALCLEMEAQGLSFQREVAIAGQYKGRPLGVAFRADLVVEGLVIVEVKAIEAITPIHRAQVLSYLRVSGIKVGLLINFHASPLLQGIHRMVNNL